MSEFNFTDNQWYNFICGFHAGLKLKDLNAPYVDTNVTLQNIGVGGYGQIGIAMPEINYNENISEYLIPVFTHDVDITYSGFSVNINWDASRLLFKGAVAGDFGTISNGSIQSDIIYNYNLGVFKAVGLKKAPLEFKEQIILFYLRIAVITNITSGDPINLCFNNSSFTDVNYTTLLKYVDVEGKPYTYYITPVVNINGVIKSEKSSSNIGTVGDRKEQSIKGSPSGIYIGTAYTAPGERGVVPIYSVSNKDDNFPYNKVHCKMIVEDTGLMFTYINIVGIGGFTVEYTTEKLNNGYIAFDITATRENKLIDSITFCYIEYMIENREADYIIPLNNIKSELIN